MTESTYTRNELAVAIAAAEADWDRVDAQGDSGAAVRCAVGRRLAKLRAALAAIEPPTSPEHAGASDA
jgi:hypothetical protein